MLVALTVARGSVAKAALEKEVKILTHLWQLAESWKCQTNHPWEEYEDQLADIVKADFTQIVTQLRAEDDSYRVLMVLSITLLMPP